jgi:hypothetical protein
VRSPPRGTAAHVPSNRCCPNTPSRKVTRDVNADARDHARSFIGTPEFDKSCDERKKVEMRFAHLKTHHGFERYTVARSIPNVRATSATASARRSGPLPPDAGVL